RLGVGLGRDSLGQYSSWPERDARHGTVGIVRRFADATKRHISGGARGLYVPLGWSRAKGPIFLPEGGSDTAAIIGIGLCAIGRPSNTGGVQRLVALLQNHRNRQIIVLGENDRKPSRVGTTPQCPINCAGCAWC